MVRMQWTIVALVIVACSATAEARGRRMMYQQNYTPYYTTTNMAPTTNVGVPVGTVVTSGTVVSSTPAAPANQVVQAGSTAPAGSVISSSVIVPTSGVTSGQIVGNSNGSAVGSAQWKAEQSARLGSVQHLGGGFGGGSFEGNGFGATPDQAIQSACFWGQKTPIQIGVARGANGYYATVFYR